MYLPICEASCQRYLRKVKFKLLYGFGGNAENIGIHFTPIEQVYKEINFHDAVLVSQFRTRINPAKRINQESSLSS
jgi:hypothetical protein